MLCGPIWRARDGISSEYPAAVALVIFQNRVRLHRQRVAVMRSGIYIDRDHVRPLFEIVLTCRREFVLIILRPAVEITDTADLPLWRRDPLGCTPEQARQQSGARKFSCCCRRRGNRRRDSGRHMLSPGDAMENEENQPTNKCNQTAGNGDEHEPTHHTE